MSVIKISSSKGDVFLKPFDTLGINTEVEPELPVPEIDDGMYDEDEE